MRCHFGRQHLDGQNTHRLLQQAAWMDECNYADHGLVGAVYRPGCILCLCCFIIPEGHFIPCDLDKWATSRWGARAFTDSLRCGITTVYNQSRGKQANIKLNYKVDSSSQSIEHSKRLRVEINQWKDLEIAEVEDDARRGLSNK